MTISKCKCIWCGEYFIKPSKGAPKKFCSSKCKQRSYASFFDEAKRQKIRDDAKAYYEANKEYAKSKRRIYVETNYETIRLAQSIYYCKNRDKKRTQQRQWTQNMKDARPEEYQKFIGDQSARSRRRSASAAISAILLPVQHHPED